MKKQLLLLFTLTITGIIARAQITITKADIKVTAFYSHTGRDTSSFINPGPAGTNQIWDYSGLTPANLDSSYTDLSNFTPNPLFPNATNAACGTFAFGSFCSYIHLSDTGLYFLGADNNFNIGYTSHQVTKATPPSMSYRFPLTYNNTASQNYKQNQVNVNGSPSPNDSNKIVYYRTMTYLVDGWGTLKTPYHTFNALRVKVISSNLDTTYNHATGGNWTLGSTTALRYDTSYSWLANGAFEVASFSKYSPKTYRYSFLKLNTTTGLDNLIVAGNGLNLYPNPSTDVLNFDCGRKIDLAFVTNTLGQDCGLKTKSNTLDVSGLTPGVYLIQVNTADGQQLVQKFVKQ